jgi:hypothetical protein
LILARGPTVSGLPSAAAIKTASMANTMGAPKVNPGTRRAPRLHIARLAGPRPLLVHCGEVPEQYCLVDAAFLEFAQMYALVL